jgi:hypothetical protein
MIIDEGDAQLEDPVNATVVDTGIKFAVICASAPWINGRH